MNQPFDSKHGYRDDYVARSKVVEINAPAQVVWEILVDLPRYGEWNPFCIAATSTFKMGDPINMTMKYLWSDETAPRASETAAALMQGNRLGEAILAAIDDIADGVQGNLAGVTQGLSLLRLVRLEGVARRTALELMLLERRG